MREAIAISFRYTKNEYLRAVRFHYYRRMRLKLDLVVAALCGAAGFYVLVTEGLSWVSLGGIVACSALLLIVFIALVILPHQVYRGAEKLKQEYDLTFSEDGILFKTSGIDSRLAWDIYDYWVAGPEFYILYYGSHQFSVIPKRTFENDAEQKRFEELLSANVRAG